jgi:hypothetical protein
MPAPADRDDTERWKSLAKEASIMAQEIVDPNAKRVLLFIAEAYCRLAERARASKVQKSDLGQRKHC